MLLETDIRDRVVYCYCVFMQLSWLYSNDSVVPEGYLDKLTGSSLELGDDAFITQTIEEALMMQRPDGGLLSIIPLYEGFVHAFCEVLEIDFNQVSEHVDPNFLRLLAEEVGVKIEIGSN